MASVDLLLSQTHSLTHNCKISMVDQSILKLSQQNLNVQKDNKNTIMIIRVRQHCSEGALMLVFDLHLLCCEMCEKAISMFVHLSNAWLSAFSFTNVAMI